MKEGASRCYSGGGNMDTASTVIGGRDCVTKLRKISMPIHGETRPQTCWKRTATWTAVIFYGALADATGFTEQTDGITLKDVRGAGGYVTLPPWPGGTEELCKDSASGKFIFPSIERHPGLP